MMDRLPVLTRLYTSMSPNEMTVDPIFVINPDLPPVARAKTLEAQVTCDNNGPTSATITGSDGARFTVPWQGALDKAPALLRAEKMTDRGAPVVTLDNSEKIKQVNHDTMASPGGCMAAGGSSLIAIAVAMFVVIARRRRSSP